MKTFIALAIASLLTGATAVETITTVAAGPRARRAAGCASGSCGASRPTATVEIVGPERSWRAQTAFNTSIDVVAPKPKPKAKPAPKEPKKEEPKHDDDPDRNGRDGPCFLYAVANRVVLPMRMTAPHQPADTIAQAIALG